MKTSKFATKYPVSFVLVLTIIWLVLLLVLMGITSTILQTSYGDAKVTSIGRLGVTVFLLFLVFRLGWLETLGILKLGRWSTWLITLVGLVYFVIASLYSFYGSISFDFSNLLELPDARTEVLTHFLAGLSEEFLFRGLVLNALIRVWGKTIRGRLGSVLLSSTLFAIVHITQFFTYGTPLTSALLLVLQSFIISIWWGALVLRGSSVWPAVILHFVVNAVVAVQGLTASSVDPDIFAYRQLLWFSLPLGLLGIGLLIKTATHSTAP